MQSDDTESNAQPGETDVDEEEQDLTLEDYYWWVYEDKEFDFAISEIRHQYDTAVSKIWSMMQRSGILLAFASVLLVESFSVPSSNLIWKISIGLLLACCALGIFTVVAGRKIRLGTNIDHMTEKLNDGNYTEMNKSLFDDKILAIKDSISISDHLSYYLIIQTLLLFFGIVAFVAMEIT